MKTQEVMGYDTAGKHFVRMVISSWGDLVNLSSPGWKAQKMVWEGTVVTNEQKMYVRETIIKKSENEFAATWEAKQAEGKWQPINDEICKKLR